MSDKFKKKILTLNKISIAVVVGFILFVGYIATAKAVEITIDPTLPDQRSMTISCTFALDREGTNEVIAIGDIAKASFYVDNGDGNGFVNANADSTTCRQVFDMTKVPDGVYTYKITETDIVNRESVLSTEFVKATVKRLPNPNSPNGLGVELGS